MYVCGLQIVVVVVVMCPCVHVPWGPSLTCSAHYTSISSVLITGGENSVAVPVHMERTT